MRLHVYKSERFLEEQDEEARRHLIRVELVLVYVGLRGEHKRRVLEAYSHHG